MMAYPIYQIIVSISAAGIPVAISIMIAEKLANDDMRGVQQVFSVSLKVLTLLGLVFSVALYGSAQWLIDSHIITDPRALLAIQLLSPAIFIVTILSCFRGYFQGFQYMVPTGTSQVFEQIFRVSSMVGLAYYFIDRGLHLAAGGATFATFPGVLAGLLVLIYFYYLAASLVPAVSEAHAQGDVHRIVQRAGTAIKIANIFTIPACIGLCVLATPISKLIYATPHAGPVIAVISLSIIFLGWQQITAGILQGLGRTVIPMIAIFIGLLAKTFLDYELTGTIELGINGAAWATNLNFAIAALINYIFVKKYVGSVLNKLELLKIVVSAMAMGGATQVVYVTTVELFGNGGAVAAAIIVAVFVYGLSLWLTKAVVKADMYHFPVIGKRLQARRDKEEAKLYEEQY